MRRQMTQKRLISLFFAFISCLSWGYAQTTVSGIISTDTTFSLAGSPWIIPDSVQIDSGATLTIDPGVTVQLDHWAKLHVYGVIKANGTASLPILFTSLDTADTAGSWKYVVVDSSSADYNPANSAGSQFNNCIFEYAGQDSIQYDGALKIKHCFPKIDSCIFRHNASSGVNAIWKYRGGTLYLQHSEFEDNAARFHGGGAMLHTLFGNSNFITLNLSYNYFLNNSVVLGTGGGLSVYLQNGKVNANWNTFEENTCYGQGGGMYVSTPLASLNQSTLSDNKFLSNSTATTGGGLSASISGNITQNLFFGNDAVYGAGIETHDGVLKRNIFANNIASSLAGAVYSNGKDTLLNNTLVDNRAIDYSAIHSEEDQRGYFRYNTITRNTSGNSPSNSTVYHRGGPTNGTSQSTYFQNCNLLRNKGTNTHYEFSTGHNFGTADILARNCWWGTNLANDIALLVEDYYDIPSRGKISYTPFLLSPDTGAPVLPPLNVRKVDLGGGDIKITWDANLESDLGGYKIYYGNPTGYSFSNSVVAGNVTSYVLSGAALITDSIAVTAYDTQMNGTLDQYEGHESWFSYADLEASAGFSISADTVCAGDTVFFSDQSVGATSWDWSFPGGNPSFSSQQNPAIVYNTPGTFLVRQIVSNSLGTDSLTISNAVTVLSVPVAFFTSATASQTVTLTNGSTGGGSSSWDFGDGTTSSQSSPVHTYANNGTYTICLYETTLCGSDTFCQSVTVACSGAPTPQFTFTANGATVNFTDQSVGPGSWSWDFGDGGSSSLQNPVHTFPGTGTYNVCLVVTNSCGSDSTCQNVTIACTAPPTNQWTFSQALSTITFTDQSVDATSWFWDFDDGSTSTNQNPVHNFLAAGTYNVCSYASNNCGSDTLCQPITIQSVGFASNPNTVFQIWPNPAQDYFFIETTQQGKLEIQDLNGKLIFEQWIQAGQSRVETTNLPQGVFLYRFNQRSGKLVVRKDRY